MDSELIAYLDKRFDGLQRQMTRQVSGLRGEMNQHLEALHQDVHVIAKGFMGLHDKVDRFQAKATFVLDQIQGWIEPHYRSLDGRLRVLEKRAERQDGDVFDAIRKLLGRPPLQKPRTSE